VQRKKSRRQFLLEHLNASNEGETSDDESVRNVLEKPSQENIQAQGKMYGDLFQQFLFEKQNSGTGGRGFRQE
jgi:hypothetical protein